jgi:hypothetical protein
MKCPLKRTECKGCQFMKETLCDYPYAIDKAGKV